MKRLVLLLFLFALLSGCASPRRRAIETLSRLPDSDFTWHYAGKSVQGRKIEYLKFGPSSDKCVFFMASIHGNEPQGTPLVMELAKYLQRNQPVDKSVIILPQANPDGLAAGTRFNANGVDLNRNFPAGNRKDCGKYGFSGLSEPESRVINKLLQKYEPDLIVSLHQAPNRHKSMPDGWFDYDGDVKDLADSMAAACGLTVHKLGTRPGSLGAYASVNLDTPIITFEQPIEDGLSSEDMWFKYGNSLLTAIDYTD